MELLLILLLPIGFAGGAYWYHYTLKHDPAKLARVVADIESAKAKVDAYRS